MNWSNQWSIFQSCSSWNIILFVHLRKLFLSGIVLFASLTGYIFHRFYIEDFPPHHLHWNQIAQGISSLPLCIGMNDCC